MSVVPPPGDYGRFGIGVESPRYLHKSEGQREGQTNGNTSKGVGKCMSLFAAELPKVDTRRTRRRRCRCGGVRIGENGMCNRTWASNGARFCQTINCCPL